MTNGQAMGLPIVVREPFFSRLSRPGLVMMALAQGAGELIWWPYLVAKYEASLLWLLIPSALFQYPVTYLLGYVTATSGKGFFRLVAEKSRSLAMSVWAMFMISFLWFGAYATSAGTAAAEIVREAHMFTSVSDKALSLTFASLIVVTSLSVLLLAKAVYSRIQRALSIVAFLVLGILLLGLFSDRVRGSLPDVMRALLPLHPRLPDTWQTADWPLLVSAILFTGLGGFWNVLYSYMIKADGIGQNRGDVSEFSYTADYGQPANEEEKRIWLATLRRNLHTDVLIGVGGNLITTILVCLLTYTFLRDAGEIPSGWRLVSVQKAILTWVPVVGPILFLALAFLFLADTWLATTDQVARVHTDAWASIFGTHSSSGHQRAVYRAWVAGLAGLTAATMLLAQPRTLLVINGIINAFAMILVIAVALLISLRPGRQEDAWWRPGYKTVSSVALSGVFYVVAFVLYLLLGGS